MRAMIACVVIGISGVFVADNSEGQMVGLVVDDQCASVSYEYHDDKEQMSAGDLSILLNCVSSDLQKRMKSFAYSEMGADSATVFTFSSSEDGCGGDPRTICIGPGSGGTEPISPKGPGPRSNEFDYLASVPNLSKIIEGQAAVLWNAETGTSIQLNRPEGIAVTDSDMSTMFMVPFDGNTTLLAPAEWK